MTFRSETVSSTYADKSSDLCIYFRPADNTKIPTIPQRLNIRIMKVFIEIKLNVYERDSQYFKIDFHLYALVRHVLVQYVPRDILSRYGISITPSCFSMKFPS